MRIAVDIDSTLHHYWDRLSDAAQRRFGIDLPYEEQLDWGITRLRPEQLDLCIQETHGDTAILAGEPYPDAVETVRGWHESGHYIQVTSHRDPPTRDATARWLERIGLPHDELHISHDKVGRCVASQIELLIDDSPENLARALGLLICALAMLVYDGSRKDSLEEGIRIGSVDVGGLDAGQARRRVSEELLEPLNEPLTIPVGRREYHLGPREARIHADVDASVDEAMRRSREGGIFARTWRGVMGGERDISIKPRIEYSTAAVDRLVARVERALNRPAIDAKVDFGPESVAVRPSRRGRKVDAKRLRADVRAELLSPIGDRTVEVSVRTVKPKVRGDQLADRYPVVVTINRGAFRLALFKRLKHVRTYPIAVGQVGLETPSGLYAIQNKAINPAWHVPNSDWAGALAGRVIPGGAPDNPLKARWLGVYDGVGVHGTSDRGSIGSNASHGCIRMLIEDVEQLYDEVPVGAPIYID